MILRNPYLASKYRKAKFWEFDKINRYYELENNEIFLFWQKSEGNFQTIIKMIFNLKITKPNAAEHRFKFKKHDG